MGVVMLICIYVIMCDGKKKNRPRSIQRERERRRAERPGKQELYVLSCHKEKKKGGVDSKQEKKKKPSS